MELTEQEIREKIKKRESENWYHLSEDFIREISCLLQQEDTIIKKSEKMETIKIDHTDNCENVERAYEINAYNGTIRMRTLVIIPDDMSNETHDIAVVCRQAIYEKFSYRFTEIR